MKTNTIIVVIAICLLIEGCSVQIGRTSRDSWIGRHYSELIDTFGEPRQVLGDGTGGKIMSWSAIPIDEELIDGHHDEKGGFFRRSFNESQVYRVNFNGIIYQQGL